MLCPWICGVDNGERERAEGDTIIDYCVFVWTNHSRSSSSKRNIYAKHIQPKNKQKTQQNGVRSSGGVKETFSIPKNGYFSAVK